MLINPNDAGTEHTPSTSNCLFIISSEFLFASFEIVQNTKKEETTTRNIGYAPQKQQDPVVLQFSIACCCG
jgi:hypothetical protein